MWDSPMIRDKCFKVLESIIFVNISAAFSVGVTSNRLTCPDSRASLTKWYFKSMCLVLVEACLFMASASAAELSLLTIVGAYTTMSSDYVCRWIVSQNILWIQLTCFTQSYKAMYSDSADETATMTCFLVLHTIGYLATVIIHLEVHFRVSLHPLQSAST